MVAAGAWKNFDELEQSLSLPELLLIIKTQRELTHNEHVFLAGLQGIDMTGGEFSGTIDRSAKDISAGMSADNPGFGYSVEGA